MPKYWGKQIFAHGRFPEVATPNSVKRVFDWLLGASYEHIFCGGSHPIPTSVCVSQIFCSEAKLYSPNLCLGKSLIVI